MTPYPGCRTRRNRSTSDRPCRPRWLGWPGPRSRIRTGTSSSCSSTSRPARGPRRGACSAKGHLGAGRRRELGRHRPCARDEPPGRPPALRSAARPGRHAGYPHPRPGHRVLRDGGPAGRRPSRLALVGFGAYQHSLEHSTTQWEHRRIRVVAVGTRTRLEEEGWQVIGTWFPWVYLKRDTGTPALPED